MIERKINRLNEEIARWAFEIKISLLPDWQIIFTNPTAGPWKKIMCYDDDNNKGEVYRFKLEEERPDIIMINDSLKAIVVIEAKDDIDKLLGKKQMSKTIEVAEQMARMFKTKSSNRYWGRRANYKTYLGLLWGNNSKDVGENVDFLFDEYYKSFKDKNNINNSFIIGIETVYNKEDSSIKCLPHYYCEENSEVINSFVTSLNRITDL